MYDLSTFDNGLRLVTVTMPHAYSLSMGIYVPLGSRYETAALAGASHFVEHMLFKGTERRPTPREIALAIEGVGGDINASTSRELTSYYARVSRDHLPIAADVLLDMLCASRFTPQDVERERQVILEEINEALDIPDELVFMNFHKLLWPNHPLGRDVAGSRKSVRALTRASLRDYMQQGYTPERAVIAIAGAVHHEQARALLAPRIAAWPAGEGLRWKPTSPRRGPKVAVLHRPIEQCHVVLGTRGLDRTDPDRFALSLLNIILGEGMSSRLFVEIREERGLAYSVYSYTSTLLDTGVFALYAAVERRQVEVAIMALVAQLRRLRDEAVSQEELAMAKAYARGRTLLRLEDTGANAGWVGSQAALLDTILTPDAILAQMDAVTAEEIQRVARALLREEALLLSLVGPVDEEADWERLLQAG